VNAYGDWTGRGGASIYGKQFDDEITDELKHTGQYGIPWFVCAVVTFCENWPSGFCISLLTNTQTNADENVISLAEVTNLAICTRHHQHELARTSIGTVRASSCLWWCVQIAKFVTSANEIVFINISLFVC